MNSLIVPLIVDCYIAGRERSDTSRPQNASVRYCPDIAGVLRAAVSGQALPAPSHFYPYGPDLGDQTAPVNDDGSTGEIPISTLFPYFEKQYGSLWVSGLMD